MEQNSSIDPNKMFISIIIPYFNVETTLRKCLDSIAAIDDKEFEVILVDNGSQDRSKEIAESYPFQTYNYSSIKSAGAARNFGVSKSKGDILLFIDSDVIVQPDIVKQARSSFLKDPTICGVIGMYSKRTTGTGFFSVYKNLESHYAHFSFDKPFISFAGFTGAVKKSVFDELNGFDLTFRGATVEDVEFGYRLSKAGHRIVLDKNLVVTHQKNFTFGKLIKTELIHRAIPWWVLLLRKKELRPNPSICLNNVLSVFIFGLCCTFVFALPVFRQLQDFFVVISVSLFTALILLNLSFYKFLFQEKSFFFTIFGIFTHQLCYLLKFIGMLTGTFVYLKQRINS
jgi:glycosyltransferase involved in cell wall biosynthesis